MSGGQFDYQQYRIKGIAEELEDIIALNKVEIPLDQLSKWELNDDGTPKEWAKYHYNFSDETIARFKEGVKYLKIAYIYAQRIDWLLSGDDDEDSFHKRLKEELDKLSTS